jgi:hypothetical protein
MQQLLRDDRWRCPYPPLLGFSLSFPQAAKQVGKPLETDLTHHIHHIFSKKTLFSHHISTTFHPSKHLHPIFTIHHMASPPLFTNLNISGIQFSLFIHYSIHLFTPI